MRIRARGSREWRIPNEARSQALATTLSSKWTQTNSGRIVRQDPRTTVWTHEAHDFTPWLADHIEDLAAKIGVELEIDTREERVGAFAADLLGRDVTTGAGLLIENQLAPTDHGRAGDARSSIARFGGCSSKSCGVRTDLQPERGLDLAATILRLGVGFPLGFVVRFSRKGPRVETYLDYGDAERTKAVFDQLHDRKTAIEAAIGAELNWARLDDQQASLIMLYVEGSPHDETDKLLDRLVDHLLLFRKVFPAFIVAAEAQVTEPVLDEEIARARLGDAEPA
jgi:hypothetical protein